jgi:DNA-binding PadR family transcriptional regulator
MKTTRELPRTPLALAVMNLLMEHPMHPYEMKVKMTHRGHDDVIRIKGGSIYDTVERLEEGGFITAQAPSREGRRPERTVYAITQMGREEIRRWMREMLAEPLNEYPQFAAALAFFAVLDKEEVVRLLRTRTARLEHLIAATEKHLEYGLKDIGVPRMFLVEVEYGLVMNRAELDWIRSLIEDIEDGKLWLTHDEMRTIGARLENLHEGGDNG